MREIRNKPDDVKNSQESVIDTINHVITDLFQHPDKALEKAMEVAHQKSSDNVDAVREVIELRNQDQQNGKCRINSKTINNIYNQICLSSISII